MVTALSESSLTLSEAAALPGAPDRSSLWRWITTGVKCRGGQRIHLEAVKLGGKLITSRQAIEAFASELAENDRRYYLTRKAATINPERTPSERQQERANEAAEQRLRARGIL